MTAGASTPDRGSRRFQIVIRNLLSRPAVFGSLIPLVTVLNALTGMVLPALLSPARFGEYALVVTLFQYGLIFDLGASQLIDKWIPFHLGSGELDAADEVGQRLLWLRLYVGVAAYVAVLLVLLVLANLGRLSFDLGHGMLSALAGLLYMVALGPACVYRARSSRRQYAISIATLSFGLVAARLGGLLAGGVTGCFLALTLWYLAFAVVFLSGMPPLARARPGVGDAVSLIVRGLPFFAASFIWAFYLTANRWFASQLIQPDHFGEFAFSANIFSLIVGAASGFSAFYYPHISQRLVLSPPFGLSRTLRVDFMKLIAGATVAIAVGILFAGWLICTIYPAYAPSVPTARILLVAVPPLLVGSWMMPLSLASGDRPWIDGMIIFPLATALLAAASFLLFRRYGGEGVACASTASALSLVAMQFAELAHAKILRIADAARLMVLTIASCLLLAGLAWIAAS